MAVNLAFILVPFLLAGLLTLLFEIDRFKSYVSTFAKPSDFRVPIKGIASQGGTKCYIKALPRRPVPRKFLTFRAAYVGCISVALLAMNMINGAVKDMDHWKIANWKGGNLIAAIVGILSFAILWSISSYFLRPLETQWLNEYLVQDDKSQL
jgi:hypothetical protein